MEKTSGREAIALSTTETGTENPALELAVMHQFSFCRAIWSAVQPPVGSLAAHNPHHLWQGPMTDPSSACAYRKKE